MILMSSLLQTQRRDNFEHFNFFIFVNFMVSLYNYLLYAIKIGDVSSFINLFFLIYNNIE